MTDRMQEKTGMAHNGLLRDYERELGKLIGNDKNIINALTELANVNKPRAPEIVAAIEKVIKQISKDRHLSHIYLIDSICKNLSEPYPSLFERNIVQTFTHIFKFANEKVRQSMHKLRVTWNDADLFTNKLSELDVKTNQLDPAWPIIKPKRPGTNNKIIINPKKLPGGMPSMPQIARVPAQKTDQERETEMIREELLRKEKELLELKKKQVEMELAKQKSIETSKSSSSTNSSSGGKSSSSSHSSAHANTNNKSDRKSSENPDRKSSETVKGSSETRDPRRRKRHEDSETSSHSKSSSHRKSSSEKSSPKKSSKSDKKSSSSSSSKTSSSSKSSSRDKDKSSSRKSASSHNKDEEKKESSGAKKRERETSPKFSRTPSPAPPPSEGAPTAISQPPLATKETQQTAADRKKSPNPGGRISPLPRPPAKKIPKIPKKEKRGEKRGQDVGGVEEGGIDGIENTPPPDKKPRPLMIDVSHADGDADGKHLSPVVAGWAKHKISNPDQFRTPIKESENFFSDQEMMMQQADGYNNRPNPHHRNNRGFWPGAGARGSYRARGGRGGPPPRGGFHPWADNVRFGVPGRGGRGVMFDHRGGGRGGMGPGGPPMNPRHFSLPGLPGLDFTQADPEYIRAEVVPKLTNLAKECFNEGKINEIQFNEFMGQVSILEETSFMKEAEKNDHFQGPGPGPRRILLGGKPNEKDQDDVVELQGPDSTGPPLNKQRSPHKNDLPMADQAELEIIKSDPTVVLEIDAVPRDIRWYGFNATITQDDNKLYEISFRKELHPRCILIDNAVKVFCGVGHHQWADFRLDNRVHRLRIGGPTRELFIDNDWHNFHFGSTKNIKIGGRLRKVYLPGDPPQVDIGDECPHLCRGKVDVGIWSNQNIPERKSKLFLDERPQLLIIDKKPHVCKFVENYSTLLINRHPFKTNFGGFPMVISVHGSKHFVKLYMPPDGVYISNVTPQPQRPLRPPPVAAQGPPPPESLMSPPNEPPPRITISPEEQGSPGLTPVTSEEIPPLKASTPLPHSLDQPPQTEPAPGLSPNSAAALEPEVPSDEGPAPDINDLWAKLQNSGVFSMFNAPSSTPAATNGGGIPGLDPALAVAATLPSMMAPPPGYPTHQQKQEQQQVDQQNNRAARMRRNSIGSKEIILKSHEPSLKERQQCIIDSLYGPNDLQCKSCGHRFTRDEMSNYSSHLDWHFRAKRRERDNARKAQSRRWYYEKADWIVSDEIEDEELDLTEDEVILEQSLEVPTVKVVAGDTGGDHETCPVCMEQFNQVFKQGGEEEEGSWYLHNAMRDPAGVPYHPECFKDKELQDSKWDEDSSIMDTSTNEIKQEPSTVNIDEDVEMAEIKKEESETKPNIETDLANVKIEGDAVNTEIKSEPNADISDVAVVKENLADNNITDDNKDGTITTEIKTELNPEAVKVEVKTEGAGDDSTAMDATETADTSTGAVDESADVSGAADKSTDEVKDEGLNRTMNLDSSDMQQAPVLAPKPKVDIKFSLTTSVKQEVTRQESQISTDDEASEFDKDSIVLGAPSQEYKDKAKPKLVGKTLNTVPMACKDQGISGLCSIM